MGAVVFLPNPFDFTEREIFAPRRRMTVRQVVARTQKRRTSVRRVGHRRVREFDKPTVCFFNGKPLMRSDWSKTVVGEKDLVLFRALPAGGGGGNGGSNPLAVVLMIAVIVAVAVLAPELAPFVAQGLGVSASTALAITQAGLSLAFGAIATGIMSLFAPPPQAGGTNFSSGYGGSPQSSPTYNLQAQGNTARLQQPIPALHGRHRIFCDFVMPPYARYVDNDQFLHVLLVCTQGEIDIEAVKIGDTPASSFASIEYEKVEPGATVPTDKVDTRFIPCTDIADTELLDATESSPWAGPFAANPPGTLVNFFEVDVTAPRGLYKFNSGGGFDTLTVDFDIEIQEIDDTGAALGSWTSMDSVTRDGATNTPQRYTLGYVTPSAGRWQVRLRRTDTKDTSATAGHELHWNGLRGRLLSHRRYAGLTLLAVKMKATGDLNGATSRQINIIGTRKLATWDPDEQAMTTAVATTRSICDAFVDVARNPIYGAGLRDDQIDLAGIYAHKAGLAALGWTFDYVWDTSSTCFDALSKIAMTALGVPIVQGGKLRLVRDIPSTAPVMMFTPRNIRKGSLGIEYKMVDEQTADSVLGTIIDPNSFKPVTLPIAAFEDSPQKNTAKLPLEGVTNYDHGWAMLIYWIRSNRYRRRVVGWGTEMEGLLLLYGDPVSFSFDIAKWGQSAEIVAWDEGSRTATLTEPMTFTMGAIHYMAVRAPDGTLTGPFEATAGAGENEIVLGEGDLPEILTGGDRERTFVQFGPGQAYAKQLKVISVQPRDHLTADILAIDDDPRMYDEVPPRPPAPIGSPTELVEVHVTEDTANINLRQLADFEGYSGLLTQPVRIIFDEGVEPYSNNPTKPAITRGSWPADFVPEVQFNGNFVTGAGGKGADSVIGGAPYGAAGQAGGTALDTSSGPLKVTGTVTLRGGAGGGGSAGMYQVYTTFGGDGVTRYPGGPGGGGRGRVGGAAGTAVAVVNGSGSETPATNGTAGSPSAGGAAGTGASGTYPSGESTATATASDGGAGGGAYGTAGASGGLGFIDNAYVIGSGGPGGAAGKSVVGYANLDLTGATVTLVGPTA